MKKSIVALICCSLLAILFNSCKKASSPDSSNFIGRWIGSEIITENGFTSPSITDTLVFLAGNDGNHVVEQDIVPCKGFTVFTFVLNGNAISLPTNTFTDSCGKKYTDSATGNLNGGTLTLNFKESIIVNIPTGSSTGGDTVETLNVTTVTTLTKK
jgi:hypothetical protein